MIATPAHLWSLLLLTQVWSQLVILKKKNNSINLWWYPTCLHTTGASSSVNTHYSSPMLMCHVLLSSWWRIHAPFTGEDLRLLKILLMKISDRLRSQTGKYIRLMKILEGWRSQKDEDLKMTKISDWWISQTWIKISDMDKDLRLVKISDWWRYQPSEYIRLMKILDWWRYQTDLSDWWRSQTDEDLEQLIVLCSELPSVIKTIENIIRKDQRLEDNLHQTSKKLQSNIKYAAHNTNSIHIKDLGTKTDTSQSDIKNQARHHVFKNTWIALRIHDSYSLRKSAYLELLLLDKHC